MKTKSISKPCEFLAQIMLRGKGGIFWPQNAEYGRTGEIVRQIADASGHKILVSKAFNWTVALASHMPGKVGGLPIRLLVICPMTKR